LDAEPLQEPPLISVIVPVFNVADFVGPCLASLKAQSFAGFEAIIVDDGSTDDSRARIAESIAGDARFRLFASPNGGLSAARNIGLALARGRFIAFLDGDDRFAPEFLEFMQGALTRSGADWVACGLRYVPVGAQTGPGHSAIHAAPVLDPEAGPVLHDLGDWRDVVQHFPSAWNKLYRSVLIAGLTFDAGTYYEDHAFFWQVAARSRTLLHLPQPLYLNTVGRAGQITRDGGERVFEQFAVLDRLRGLLDAAADREGRTEAMAEIAVRLIRERGAVIADPVRTARFADRARDYFESRGIDWQARVLKAVPLGRFDRALLGRRALCVILPSDGQVGPLQSSLESLARQELADFDVLIVSDGLAPVSALADAAEAAEMDRRVTILGPDVRIEFAGTTASARVAMARNRGLAAAGADFVVFLDAGDLLLPETLDAWLGAMVGSGADMGFSAYRIGASDGALHGGVHDEAPFALAGPDLGPDLGPKLEPDAAQAVHAMPSAKMFRRAHLLDHGIVFAPHALQTWQVVLQVAANGACQRLPGAGMVQGESAGARQFWRAEAPQPDDLAAMVDAIAASLPAGWWRKDGTLRLLARAYWERLYFAAFSSPAAKSEWAWQAQALWHARSQGVAGAEACFDPYMSAAFRRFLGGTGDLPRP
jgi:glycosyltransferase involved in cell wall biosynthesis